jgi:hypothetical protein
MSETVEQAARRLLSAKIALGYVPRALHAYVNADGQSIYYRARLEHPDGDVAPEGRKIIRPLYANGNGYKIGEPEFPAGAKPLYNLDKIAAEPNAVVFVVEGEKAADALTKRGALATTSGGADSAQRADWRALAERRCILWPDNDQAGRAYMGDVAAILEPLGCELSAINVDALALPAKGDAFDWLADRAQATLSDLLALPRLDIRPPDERAPTGESGPVVHLVRGDAIALRPIDWLWDEFLARGKVHMFGGAPGDGKTTLAVALAATVTQGGRWPDGSRATPGDVLIWSGEDSIDDTLAPRLVASRADMSRVHFVGGVRVADESVSFDPALHFPALALQASRLPELRMMIVDPIVSAVAGDSHKNAEVRRGLAPLVAFAEQSGCAIVGITHFSKGTQGREPVERLTGSLGFGAVTRIAFGTAKLPEDEGGGRVLVRIKSNIGKDGGGFRYDVRPVEISGGITATRIEWGQPIEGSAKEILAKAETDDVGPAKPADFLAELLADGPMHSSDVFKDATANGYSKQQMYRAKDALGVEARKLGMKEGWQWYLPSKLSASLEGTEDTEDFGLVNADTFDAKAPADTEDTEHNEPIPSSSSGRWWRITRADGSSFRTTTVQPMTSAVVAEQYPGCKVERMDLSEAA